MTRTDLYNTIKEKFPTANFSAWDISIIIGVKSNLCSIWLHGLVKDGRLGKFIYRPNDDYRSSFLYFIKK